MSDYQTLVTKAQKSRKGRKRLRYYLLALAITILIAVPVGYHFLEVYEDTYMVKNKIKVESVDFEKKTVMNPKYMGKDDKGQPYRVVAQEASQEKEDLVRLQKVQGEMTLTNNHVITLKANEGYMHTALTKKLDLYGNVYGTHDLGYEVWTDVAHMDFKNSTILGPEKVKAKSHQGTATAQRFVLDYNKKLLILYGKPHLTIMKN